MPEAPTPRRFTRLVAAVVTAGAALSACGGTDASTPELEASDWGAVLARADGQTVRWAVPVGDDDLDRFVDGEIASRLADLGVTLDRVGTTDRSIDAIWIDGEGVADGARDGRWSCGWADDLPNARYVDLEDPVVSSDFGAPVEGCAAVWQRTSSALVYDSTVLARSDVASIGSLLSWSRAHPGRFTYPAPPDRAGSVAVRSILYAQIDGSDKLPEAFDEAAFENGTAPLWKLLEEVEPTLWNRGDRYPTTQDDVEQLYADGEISVFVTDRPGAVSGRVADGTFARSTRQAAPIDGTVARAGHLAIPAEAAHPAAALVLADVLQDPEVQLALHEATGALPGIDVTRLPTPMRRAFEEAAGSAGLSIAQATTHGQPDLAAEYVMRIDEAWRAEVLRR